MKSTGNSEPDPRLYGEDYYLSEDVEGYALFRAGKLSALRRKHIAMLMPLDGARLLEIGFARGELLRACADAGARVTGIDFSPHACRIAAETTADRPAPLVRGDCRGLPFANESFDRVFAGDVIEHLAHDDGPVLLREMWRVLRPGGFLLVHTTPNTLFRHWTWPALRPLLRCINPQAAARTDAQFTVMDRVHLGEYSPRRLRACARRAGLPNARVWLDPDLLRAAEHRITGPLSRHPLVRVAAWGGQAPPFRVFLGNDLYLRCEK